MVEIIAEISGNFGGDKAKMLNMIRRAAECGCDYAKFQFYRPSDLPDFDPRYNPVVPEDWFPKMFEVAKNSNIGLFASVFHPDVVPLLLKFDVEYIKIASPESTRLPQQTYRAIAAAVPWNVGLIVSSGVKDAEFMQELRANHTVWMYCPPGHPPTENFMDELVDGGFEALSDHSPGISIPKMAIDLTMLSMIEKHFKIDNNCVDAEFSADPPTMTRLCNIAHR